MSNSLPLPGPSMYEIHANGMIMNKFWGGLARNGFPAVIWCRNASLADIIRKHHQNLKHRYFFKSTPPPHDLPIVSPPWVPPMPLTQTDNHEPRRSEHTPAQRCNGVKLDSDSGWSFWGQCQSVKVCQSAIRLAFLAQWLRICNVYVTLWYIAAKCYKLFTSFHFHPKLTHSSGSGNSSFTKATNLPSQPPAMALRATLLA